jgi:hypothetical protein
MAVFRNRNVQVLVLTYECVVGLEQGPLSLMKAIEELLERKSSGYSLENRDYGRRGSSMLTTRHYPKSWH